LIDHRDARAIVGPVPLLGDPKIEAALANSPLASMPRAKLERMFDHAMLLEVPEGAVPQRPGDGMVPGMLAGGLLRVFQTMPDGRQLTVRYVRSGGLLAIATLYMKRTGQLSQQALSRCQIIRFRPDLLLSLAASDAEIANAFAAENARRLFGYLDELAGNTFGTMRQRVARHLLDLAAADHKQPALIAQISQQDLADAVGTVREVVVRVLRELREAGLVRTGRDRIEIVAADRLVEETFGLEN